MFKPKDNLFKCLVNISQLGIYIMQDKRFRLINPEMIKITGYSKEELMRMVPMELVIPEDRKRVREQALKALKGEREDGAYEFRVKAKDGTIKWILEKVVPIQFHGRPATLSNFMDITRQKEIEQELIKTNEILQATLSASPVGIVLAENRVIRWANNEMSRLFGYSLEEFRNLPARQLYVSDEEYERVGNIIYEMLKKADSAEMEARFKKKDGSLFWGLIRMSPFDPDLSKKGVITAIFDISQRKGLEKDLFEEKELVNITLRSIGDGVICTDEKGNITLMNRVAEELTGWKEKEAIGKPISRVFHIINEITRESVEDPVEKVLNTGAVVGLANHTILVSKDGRERYLADSGAPIRDNVGNIRGVVLVFRDITENRALEREMQRLEKLEAIGTLAGGIAHDFNNMLMGIIGNISLAKMETNSQDIVRNRLEDAERILIQAKNLAQQLLTFSKGGAPIKKVVHVGGLIKEIARFSLRGSNVGCTFEIAEELWPAEIDEGQIGQVISNIVINAQQAMPAGGMIKIKAENVEVSEMDHLPIKEGRYIRISIQDTGIGIPQGSLDKIFDPYFTTKQKGSGLGLAVAHSIIKNHDGYLGVESELGKGSRFDIYLPASVKEIAQKKEPVIGKGRILVMDDEELVLDVIKGMLSMLGYKVEVARDGEGAVKLYEAARAKGEPFDVVILDLTVPGGMGGKETMQRLLKIDPDVKAIVSSGYSHDPIMSNYKKYGFKAVIAKPYGINELTEVLSKVFES